jgi:hypothetical protein
MNLKMVAERKPALPMNPGRNIQHSTSNLERPEAPWDLNVLSGRSFSEGRWELNVECFLGSGDSELLIRRPVFGGRGRFPIPSMALTAEFRFVTSLYDSARRAGM